MVTQMVIVLESMWEDGETISGKLESYMPQCMHVCLHVCVCVELSLEFISLKK